MGHGHRFPAPGSIDFHHTIAVRQLRATVDVHIHYSLEPEETGTVVSRWLVLDVSMPAVVRPLRSAITARFEKENLRTVAALKQYAETHTGDDVPSPAGPPLSPGAQQRQGSGKANTGWLQAVSA